jgi:hypothetical protein
MNKDFTERPITNAIESFIESAKDDEVFLRIATGQRPSIYTLASAPIKLVENPTRKLKIPV